MKRRVKEEEPVDFQNFEGDYSTTIKTGSTLLDLAISGGRVRGGGLPGGIFVEVFGPEASGKTVILNSIASYVQEQGGQTRYYDPEGRLNNSFAMLFGMDLDPKDYSRPNRVPEIFNPIASWKPKNMKAINGIFADSLAALSTQLEMENEDGDKMGGRRGKEFSEGLRKTCRVLADNNYLMVCSNQIRDVMGAMFGQKHDSPGGWAIKFYSSLRLKTFVKKRLDMIVKTDGKEVENDIGIRIQVEVVKSSVWKPNRKAFLTILWDYGIDDIRENLQFIKDHTANNVYTLQNQPLNKAMDEAIKIIEKDNLEQALKEETIKLWTDIENQFSSNRKPKIR